MAPRADGAFVELATIIRAFQQSRAVTAAAELGIADLLRSGARSVDDLAQASGSNAAALYRLLRALAAIGVFDEQPDRRLRADADGRVPADRSSVVARPGGPDVRRRLRVDAWGELTSSVRTGRTAAVIALDMDVWEYRRRHPDESETFDATMTTFASALSPNLVEAYDFSRHEVIADIGGGTGAALAAILEECPAARGVLFDQPHVVAGAPELLAEQGVADRVRVEAGDFFESVPDGADAYVLRRILHDWPDEEAIAILRVVRRAMGPSSRLIIVDCVVGPPNEDAMARFLDLMMLVSAGGRERTQDEWTSLLAEAGLRWQQRRRSPRPPSSKPSRPESSACSTMPASTSAVEIVPRRGDRGPTRWRSARARRRGSTRSRLRRNCGSSRGSSTRRARTRARNSSSTWRSPQSP